MLGISYGECMLVEDADAGIEAGKKAGMKTVSVHGAKGADVEIEDLNEKSLIDYLRS